MNSSEAPILILCKVKSCDRKKGTSRGLCDAHYKRLQTTGDIMPHIPIAPHRKQTPCSVENCGSRSISVNGLCAKHHSRLKRGIDIRAGTIFDSRNAVIEGGVAKIPVGVNAKDGYAIVDIEMAYLDRYKWRSAKGYPVTSDSDQNGKTIRIHAMIMGVPIKGYVVDHINRDPLDNRRENLRITTMSVNTINRGIQSNNKSGYRGVFWHKQSSSWAATVRKNDKQTYKTGFISPELAAEEYKKMFKITHGDIEVVYE